MKKNVWKKTLMNAERTAQKIIDEFNSCAVCPKAAVVGVKLVDAIPRELEDIATATEKTLRSEAESVLPTMLTKTSWWLIHKDGAVNLLIKNHAGLFNFLCCRESDEADKVADESDDVADEKICYLSGAGKQCRDFKKIRNEVACGLVSFDVDDSGGLEIFIESPFGRVWELRPRGKISGYDFILT